MELGTERPELTEAGDSCVQDRREVFSEKSVCGLEGQGADRGKET